MSIGEKIKTIRMSKNMNQSELAKKANLSRVAIGTYERDERSPNITVLANIAKALETTVESLLETSEQKNKHWSWDEVKLVIEECGYEVTEIENDDRNVKLSIIFPDSDELKLVYIFNKENLIKYIEEQDAWIRSNTRNFLLGNTKNMLMAKIIVPEIRKRCRKDTSNIEKI